MIIVIKVYLKKKTHPKQAQIIQMNLKKKIQISNIKNFDDMSLQGLKNRHA